MATIPEHVIGDDFSQLWHFKPHNVLTIIDIWHKTANKALLAFS
jgi:hypothetical protein